MSPSQLSVNTAYPGCWQEEFWHFSLSGILPWPCAFCHLWNWKQMESLMPEDKMKSVRLGLVVKWIKRNYSIFVAWQLNSSKLRSLLKLIQKSKPSTGKSLWKVGNNLESKVSCISQWQVQKCIYQWFFWWITFR